MREDIRPNTVWNGLGKPSSLNVIIMEGMKGHAAVPQRTNAVKYFFLDFVTTVIGLTPLHMISLKCLNLPNSHLTALSVTMTLWQ